MNNPGVMGRFERIGNLDRNFQDLGAGQGLVRDQVLQGLPFEQLHHDEGLSFELINLVDDADVGMIEAGGGPGFPLKALQGHGVADQFGRKKLQGDASTQAQIQGAIDDSHTAATQFLFDPVMRNSLAQHREFPRRWLMVGRT